MSQNKTLWSSKILVFAMSLMWGLSSFAKMPDVAPWWFIKDVERRASWLPSEIHRLGLNEAIMARWRDLPQDIQVILSQARVPAWMLPLIPNDPSRTPEIYNQLRSMMSLAGTRSGSVIGDRAEQLLIFGGAAQLPTPGDATTGRSLGPEGCTAAMSKYILTELQLEFPNELSGLPAQLTVSQSSAEMKALFYKVVRSGNSRISIQEVPFESLQNAHVPPGSIMIAEKPGGTHTFGWTRVPSAWNWRASNKIAIGNTGLPQFGNRMILAQEFLTDYPTDPQELTHNQHGPINSRQVVYSGNKPVLSDSRTNVYAVRGSNFIIISFN